MHCTNKQDCPNQTRFPFSSSAPTKIEDLTAGSDEKTQRRPWVRFPAGLRCVFSSDPAVSSSIFVGAEREENLIRNDPDKSEFTIKTVQVFFFLLLFSSSVTFNYTLYLWLLFFLSLTFFFYLLTFRSVC